jgi:hypothetical protein
MAVVGTAVVGAIVGAAIAWPQVTSLATAAVTAVASIVGAGISAGMTSIFARRSSRGNARQTGTLLVAPAHDPSDGRHEKLLGRGTNQKSYVDAEKGLPMRPSRWW